MNTTTTVGRIELVKQRIIERKAYAKNMRSIAEQTQDQSQRLKRFSWILVLQTSIKIMKTNDLSG